MKKARILNRRRGHVATLSLLLVLATGSGYAGSPVRHHSVRPHADNRVARIDDRNVLPLGLRASTFATTDTARLLPAYQPVTVDLRGTLSVPSGSVGFVVLKPQSAVMKVDAQSTLSELALARFEAEQRCLAEAMYYEARGEGVAGQEAIAEVIFHRLHRRGYPGSICGVVYQGAGDGGTCQFSFACDGERDRPRSAAAWSRAQRLAAKILGGRLTLNDVTQGATSFHAADIEPRWSSSLERTVQIGRHIFYRPMPRTRAS